MTTAKTISEAEHQHFIFKMFFLGLLLPASIIACSLDTTVPSLPQRLVHLDLKGAPPKIAYYESFFPFIVGLGATGLLLEYEDMFPYHGPLRKLAQTNAYSRAEVVTLLALARQYKLQVVPLIQTFGHMEFVLKHQQFVRLREVPRKTYTICPSDNGTHFLLQAMVDQVLELHPEAKWLHIGSDEVYDLGKCSRCHDRMHISGLNSTQLFLDHVISVAKYVRSAYSVEVIIWDDILHSISEEQIRGSKIHEYVVPMVWKYHRTVWNDLYPDLWEKYCRIFPRLWIASAFKGATGQTQQLPDLRHHLDNHCSWMEVVRRYSNRTNFLGIALTGWQRYNHYAPLCELLPSAVPSLTLDLAYLNNRSIQSDTAAGLLDWTSSVLWCREKLSLDRYRDDLDCTFPGSDVFRAVLRYKTLQDDNHRLRSKEEKRHLLEKVHELKKFVRGAFGEIFYEDSVDEWLDTYLVPLSDKIEYVISRFEFRERPTGRFGLNEQIEKQ